MAMENSQNMDLAALLEVNNVFHNAYKKELQANIFNTQKISHLEQEITKRTDEALDQVEHLRVNEVYIQTMHTENAQLKKELAEAIMKIADLQRSAEKTVEMMERDQFELEKLDERNREQEEILEELRGVWNNDSKSFQEAMANLRAANATVEKEVELLKQSEANNFEAIADLKKKLRSSESNLSDQKRIVLSLSSQYDEVMNNLEDEKDLTCFLRSDISSLKLKLENEKARTGELNGKLDDLSADHFEEKQLVMSLREKVDSLELAFTLQNMEEVRMSAEIEELKTKLHSETELRTEMNRQIEKLKEELSQSKAIGLELSNVNEDLTFELTKAEEMHRVNVDSLCEQREKVNDSLEKFREHHMETVRKYATEYDKMTREKEALEKEATLAKNQHANLKDAFEKWTTDNQAELESSKMMIKQLAQELKETQKALERTEADSEAMVAYHKDEKNAIGVELENVVLKNEDLVKQLKEARVLCDQANKRVTEKENKIGAMKGDYILLQCTMDRETELHNERVERLTSKMQPVCQKLKEERLKAEDFANKLCRSENVVKGLNSQITTLTDMIINMERRHADDLREQAQANCKLVENMGVEEIDDEEADEAMNHCEAENSKTKAPEWELVDDE